MLKIYEKGQFGLRVVVDYGLDFIECVVEKEEFFLLYYFMIFIYCFFSLMLDFLEWVVDDMIVMQYKGYVYYFEDMMVYIDWIIGDINVKLVELGIVDNIFVIFIGDNGMDVFVVLEMID